MIYHTPYDTTAGRMYATTVKKIREQLEEHLITHGFTTLDENSENECKDYMLVGKPEEGNIPLFAHPIDIYDTKKELAIVSDARPFITYKKESETFTVKNRMEYELSEVKHKAQNFWLTGNRRSLRDMSIVPMSVYTSWISESVARRYALEIKDQMVIAIIAGFFYLTLFEDGNEFTEMEMTRMVSQVMRATKAPGPLVQEVAQRLDTMSNIEGFCKVTAQVVENTRLEEFNAGVLVTIVGNTWFGTNAKEILAVALEHPPTWIALVHTALKERSYKNTALARIALRYALNKGGNDFIRSFTSTCL